MIIESILNLFKSILNVLFGWINLPNLPQDLLDRIDEFLDLVFGNISALGFFVRPATLVIVIPITIALLNFDKIYKFTMFIIKKIPMLNIR